jgi:hypothetical protein
MQIIKSVAGVPIRLTPKTSHSRFAKISGRIYSLYFGASFAPRIEHAASQIQDSRDLSLLPLLAIFLHFANRHAIKVACLLSSETFAALTRVHAHQSDTEILRILSMYRAKDKKITNAPLGKAIVCVLMSPSATTRPGVDHALDCFQYDS